jgi:hypothetical protein
MVLGPSDVAIILCLWGFSLPSSTLGFLLDVLFPTGSRSLSMLNRHQSSHEVKEVMEALYLLPRQQDPCAEAGKDDSPPTPACLLNGITDSISMWGFKLKWL